MCLPWPTTPMTRLFLSVSIGPTDSQRSSKRQRSWPSWLVHSTQLQNLWARRMRKKESVGNLDENGSRKAKNIRLSFPPRVVLLSHNVLEPVQLVENKRFYMRRIGRLRRKPGSISPQEILLAYALGNESSRRSTVLMANMTWSTQLNRHVPRLDA